MTYEKPKLSVIVPVSGEPDRIMFLGSWFKPNKFVHLEIIIVEDNLKEETKKELDKQLSGLYSEYSQIRVVGNFGNPGDARNAGLTKVTGDWVAFWDSDDLPDLVTVAEILIEPESRKNDFIYTDFLIKSDSSGNLAQNRFAAENQVVNLSLIALEPGIWRFVFKRGILEGISFPAFRMGEDQIFMTKLELHKHKGRYVNRNTYIYRKGITGQLTENQNRVKYLEPSLNEQLMIIRKQPSRFGKIVVIKQSVTLIITGNFSSKLKGFQVLLRATFLHRSWRELIYVLVKQTRLLGK
jgi:glycosyltransferase involved in cell wall biosynthesis